MRRRIDFCLSIRLRNLTLAWYGVSFIHQAYAATNLLLLEVIERVDLVKLAVLSLLDIPLHCANWFWSYKTEEESRSICLKCLLRVANVSSMVFWLCDRRVLQLLDELDGN